MTMTNAWAERHPSTQHFEASFDFAHLPQHLKIVSAPAAAYAGEMLDKLPDGPELSAGLRKLVEAKDCFVRAAVAATKAAGFADGGVVPEQRGS